MNEHEWNDTIQYQIEAEKSLLSMQNGQNSCQLT